MNFIMQHFYVLVGVPFVLLFLYGMYKDRDRRKLIKPWHKCPNCSSEYPYLRWLKWHREYFCIGKDDSNEIYNRDNFGSDDINV